MDSADAAVTSRGRAGLLESARRRVDGEPRLRQLLEVVTARADRWVQNPTLVVEGELADWWHVAWERLSDVAFAQAWDPDPVREAWLRAETLRICGLPADDWIGPFFRGRYDPPIGMLETAHVGLGVATILELCPELFSSEETAAIHDALREKCLIPCENGLLAHEESGFEVSTPQGPHIVKDYLQNHYWVLLDAFGALALMLGDDARVATVPDRFNLAQDLHNRDSYGETVQYWGYAAIHLTNLWELTDAYRPDLVDRLGRPDVAMMPWLAHSIMFTGSSRPWGPGRYTTVVNFGDSALTGRPPADALSSISRYARTTDPQNAGLARWLIEQTYADPELAPSELSSFGFFNQVGWRTVVNLAAAAEPVSPVEAGLGVVQGFETGMVAVRDRWDDPRAVLAVQAGQEALNVDSHRHDDHGSFVLGFGGEVLFTDPGHCCYRLQAYRDAIPAEAHSTWTLRDGTGRQLARSWQPEAPIGRRRGPERVGDAVVTGVDLADLYGGAVRQARRTWISVLPHVVLMVDQISADSPIAVDSRFVLDNRDTRLRVDHLSSSRVVLRRGAAAAQLVRLHTTADGTPDDTGPRRSWTAAHDIYHPQPNADTQGKEGSAVVYTFSSGKPARSVEAVYAVVMAPEAEIADWQVSLAEDTVMVTPPDGRTLQLRLPDYVTHADTNGID